MLCIPPYVCRYYSVTIPCAIVNYLNRNVIARAVQIFTLLRFAGKIVSEILSAVKNRKNGTVENAVCELSVWEPVYRSLAGLTNGQWDTVSLSPLPPALRLESPASVSLTEIRTYSPSPPLTLTLHRDSCVFKEITYTCFEELKKSKDRKLYTHTQKGNKLSNLSNPFFPSNS